jgi:hypothetical protein
MSDLERLGLVVSANVEYGNELTALGRDVADAGLASIWPELAKIHPSAREARFLSKLYEVSAVKEERWADLVFVDADEVAGLIGLDAGEPPDAIRRRTLFGDLERKGLLEAGPRFGGGPTPERPTYVAAVLLTETVEGGLSRVAGAVGASTPLVAEKCSLANRDPKAGPKEADTLPITRPSSTPTGGQSNAQVATLPRSRLSRSWPKNSTSRAERSPTTSRPMGFPGRLSSCIFFALYSRFSPPCGGRTLWG